jgi:hypothetical protein
MTQRWAAVVEVAVVIACQLSEKHLVRIPPQKHYFHQLREAFIPSLLAEVGLEITAHPVIGVCKVQALRLRQLHQQVAGEGEYRAGLVALVALVAAQDQHSAAILALEPEQQIRDFLVEIQIAAHRMLREPEEEAQGHQDNRLVQLVLAEMGVLVFRR